MIVQIPKDIDAVEAKIFAGLSLKKMGFAAIAAAIVLFLKMKLHLPTLAAALPGGIILFLGFYSKHGMDALTLSIRMFQLLFTKQEYYREPIASSKVLDKKATEKAAKEWNHEMARQKKRHPNMETIPSVRCERTAKSRK